jgi:hypothetical protein
LCEDKWADKNAKDSCKCGEITNPDALRLKSRCKTNIRRRLRESVRRKKPELWPDKWIPYHDALRVHEFLAKKSITKMGHLLYSQGEYFKGDSSR